MRPTTKDLAEAAGVSLATVDRVLNERPNVSNKVATKVAEAIERIGFVRNPAAVALARNKTYRFRFVLPKSGDQYLAELIARVTEAKDALRADSTEVEVAQMGGVQEEIEFRLPGELRDHDVKAGAPIALALPPAR